MGTTEVSQFQGLNLERERGRASRSIGQSHVRATGRNEGIMLNHANITCPCIAVYKTIVGTAQAEFSDRPVQCAEFVVTFPAG